jgi:hypothetical protein
MTPHIVLHFSPSKAPPKSAPVPPRREIQPSPEKKCLSCTTVILSKREATASGSPVKKRKDDLEPVLGMNSFSNTNMNILINSQIDAQFDIELGRKSRESKALQDTLATSKRIELDYPLIMDGRPWGPPADRGFTDLLNLFSTTFAVEIRSPFLIIRVHTLPPKPWTRRSLFFSTILYRN